MGHDLLRWTAWKRSRRAIFAGAGGVLLLRQRAIAQTLQEEQQPNDHRLKLPDANDDPRMPDGKSQKNAIAKEQHEQALKDADQLVSAAEDLRSELRKSGTYVVPLTAVKRTEEIEKLAKRIRGKLKS